VPNKRLVSIGWCQIEAATTNGQTDPTGGSLTKLRSTARDSEVHVRKLGALASSLGLEYVRDTIAFVLVVFPPVGYRPSMTDPPDKLRPADPRDLADAFAFALRYQGRKRVHNADEIMAEIVAKRLVEHLERAGRVALERCGFPWNERMNC
jgi:hypothetical protein